MHSLPGNLPESVLMLYPALRSLPTEQLAAICPATALLKLPAGAQVFTEKQNCLGFPLILAGTIKVVKNTAAGRELLLYRVQPGGSCIITSSCLLAHSPYSARGIAETPLSLLLLPVPLFEKLIAENGLFRDFVFHLFGDRIAELLQLAFGPRACGQRLRDRLAFGGLRCALEVAAGLVETVPVALDDNVSVVEVATHRVTRTIEVGDDSQGTPSEAGGNSPECGR